MPCELLLAIMSCSLLACYPNNLKKTDLKYGQCSLYPCLCLCIYGAHIHTYIQAYTHTLSLPYGAYTSQ